MSFAGKVLSKGTISTVDAALLTAAVGTTAYVKHMGVKNVSDQTVRCTLSMRVDGADIAWRTFDLEEGEFASVLEGEGAIALDGGQQLRGSADVGAALEYVISGALES